jgi:hypothetical protein
MSTPAKTSVVTAIPVMTAAPTEISVRRMSVIRAISDMSRGAIRINGAALYDEDKSKDNGQI